MSNPIRERPVRAFVVSLIGGMLIFIGGAALPLVKTLAFSPGTPLSDVVGVSYAAMLAAGFSSGFAYAAAVLSGVIPGIGAIVSALMIYYRPAKAPTWGLLVMAFSVISLIGTGGFEIGAVLGLVGGSMALTKQRSPPIPVEHRPAMTERAPRAS